MVKSPVLLNKTLGVGVIVILIGAAFAPSLYAESINDKLVKVTIEFCGIGKRHIENLKSDEAEELDVLFDTIRLKLDNAKSEDETIQIFNEGIRELDRYGLLGSISITQAQSFITGKYKKSRLNILSLDENENRNCLIIGKTTQTWFESPGTVLCYKIMDNTNYILWLISFVGYIYLSLFSYFNPLSLFYRINFGKCIYEHEMQPVEIYSSGWIYTMGINGGKNWEGIMQGDLPIEGTSRAITNQYSIFYPGAVGFTGLKISSDNNESYIGYARHVKIYCDKEQFI